MKNNFYTYAYLREDGTPYYIGKGQGGRAFKKSGRRSPIPPRERILFLKTGLTEEEALKHEVYMIAVFGRKDLGTGILWNFTDGGEGVSGLRFTDEQKKKIGEASRKKTMSQEAREKISKAMSGRKVSDETKQKLSAVMKGKKPSTATIEALKKALTGKKQTEEHKRKVNEALKGRRGRKKKEGKG
jgi:hypothetical protein